MPRLDEMNFEEISKKYYSLLSMVITKDEFEKVKNEIEGLYSDYEEKVLNDGFKVKGGTFGRGEIKWGRNIIWGWFIELLIKQVLMKNKDIEDIQLLGGDSSHSFIFDLEKKKIDIKGVKSVDPDFLVILKNKTTFTIELKTAAVGIFSIKKGNIERLYKETAFNNRLNIILMIDLDKGLFGIENLNYFVNQKPFVNNRMEGQLCYEFPTPIIHLNELIQFNFKKSLDDNIFNYNPIKKLQLYNYLKMNNNTTAAKLIEQKIKLDKLQEDLDFQTNSIKEQMEKIINKYPDINQDWDEIFRKYK